MRRIVIALVALATLVIGTPGAYAASENSPTWWISGGTSADPLDIAWVVHWEKLNVWQVDITGRGPAGASFTKLWSFDQRQASGHLEGTEHLTDGYWEVDFYLRLPNGALVHSSHRGVVSSGSYACYGQFTTCP